MSHLLNLPKRQGKISKKFHLFRGPRELLFKVHCLKTVLSWQHWVRVAQKRLENHGGSVTKEHISAFWMALLEKWRQDLGLGMSLRNLSSHWQHWFHRQVTTFWRKVTVCTSLNCWSWISTWLMVSLLQPRSSSGANWLLRLHWPKVHGSSTATARHFQTHMHCMQEQLRHINSHVWELVFSLDTRPATSSSVNVAWTEGCTCAARFWEDAYKKHRSRPVCGKVCPHFTWNSFVMWQISNWNLMYHSDFWLYCAKHYIYVFDLLSI